MTAALRDDLVEVEAGRRLRAVRAGQGAPLVVFASGLMAPASEWVAVQRLVSEHTATLSYDRAGMGGSDDDPVEPTVQQVAQDLVRLLDAVGATEPVVLVGHSWAGPVLRLVAEQHPERLAALCFVDASVAQVLSERFARAQLRLLRVLGALRRWGVHRWLLRATLRKKLSGLAAADRDLVLVDLLADRTLLTARRETAAMVAGDLRRLAELQQRGLPDLPVTSVVGAVAERGARRSRPVMVDVQRSEMGRHAQGRLVVAARSGHMVPQQQPELVADEVLRLAAATRGQE